MLDVIQPPVQYDFPFPKPAIEVVIPVERISKVCGLLSRSGSLNLANGQIAYACSQVYIGGCLIVLPMISGKITLFDQQNLRRHENAHCNGWPAWHPVDAKPDANGVVVFGGTGPLNP